MFAVEFSNEVTMLQHLTVRLAAQGVRGLRMRSIHPRTPSIALATIILDAEPDALNASSVRIEVPGCPRQPGAFGRRTSGALAPDSKMFSRP